MSASRTTVVAIPGADVTVVARRLWKRIATRFEVSKVWRLVAPETAAAEFLSVLRAMLAPARVEAAIYFRDTTDVIAATLPQTLVPSLSPSHGDGDGAFSTADFFARGRLAVSKWSETLRPDSSFDQGATTGLADHFSSFGEPLVYELGGGFRIHVLADRAYNEEAVKAFIQGAELGQLLSSMQRVGRTGMAPPVSRKLSDYLLHEYVDRLENDLAVLIEGEAPDIWVLLPDQDGSRLQFHAPRQKLERVLHYYLGQSWTTVGHLRERILQGEDTRGDLMRYVAPCESGYHRYLASRWNDADPLTVEHLECIAEKFAGWPMDRGIAASVVETGCSEALLHFAEDYRVKAYRYDQPLAHPDGVAGADSFFRVLLAERVFISIRPHLVEIPLVWRTTQSGGSQCGALLLVLLNGKDASDTLAHRALSIREAVEPWYLLFDQHAQLTQWTRVIHAHVVHEVNGLFAGLDSSLPDDKRESLATGIRRLWAAYSFLSDDRGPLRVRTSLSEFLAAADRAAVAAAQSREGRVKLRSTLFDSPEVATAQLEVATDGVCYLLQKFLTDSLVCVENLGAAGLLEHDGEAVEFRSVVSVEALVLEVQHQVDATLAVFLSEHGPFLGYEPIFTDGRTVAHLGLYYCDVLLRGYGGEFRRPTLDCDRNHVTWSFRFPLVASLGGGADAGSVASGSRSGRRS